ALLPEAPSARISRGFEPAGLAPAPPRRAIPFIAPKTAPPPPNPLKTKAVTQTTHDKTLNYNTKNKKKKKKYNTQNKKPKKKKKKTKKINKKKKKK
ncbi:hypothetical protein ACVGXO_00140, partial [Enterobacter hormaechei]